MPFQSWVDVISDIAVFILCVTATISFVYISCKLRFK